MSTLNKFAWVIFTTTFAIVVTFTTMYAALLGAQFVSGYVVRIMTVLIGVVK